VTNLHCIANNGYGTVILHPDILLSSTVVAEYFSCPRKAVLDERVRRGIGLVEKSILFGIMVHELFQRLLSKGNFSTAAIEDGIELLIAEYLESIYCANENEETARASIKEFIPLFQNWLQKHVTSLEPQPLGLDRNGLKFKVDRVMEIEEGIWSPTFGLRGKIDVTLQGTIVENNTRKVLTLPLELKSGKAYNIISHRAQTILYSLMMTERYGNIVFDICMFSIFMLRNRHKHTLWVAVLS
jgi:DNA replication ATP-dependent helicase Dna2